MALTALAALAPLACNVSTLGFYVAACDSAGNLLPPPGGLQRAVDLSVAYYARSPLDLPLSHGFPSFVFATFMDGLYIPTSLDIIAGMQDGMGILGYVKLAARARAGRGGNATAALEAAVFLGDYLVRFANSPSFGAWPNVTRSTGVNIEWPLITASQGDINFGINCIETDRAGMAGYALLRLHEALGGGAAPSSPYLAQAVSNARALAANMQPGNATHAPWPFRVDAVTGAHVDGAKNGETAFPLRLLRALAAPPYAMAEFAAPAAALWAWVRDVQLPTARANVSAEECLFCNFFEDRGNGDTNRNSWTALELARALIEGRAAPGGDADWRAHSAALFDYALANFAYPSGLGNVTLMGEQDNDRKGWGGASSKLGGVAALFACAGGGDEYMALARGNLHHMAYFTAPDDGARSAEAYLVGSTPTRGGWTEDAWLDVLHNLVDGLEAMDGVC